MRAASLWSSIAGVHHLFDAMQQVAFLVERGVVPPFEMSYKTYEIEEVEKMIKEAATDEEARSRYWQDGYIRMALLSYILKEGETREAGRIAYSLAAYAGEWGEKLGWRILDSPVFSLVVKMGVAQAFIERGLLKEGEPVRMNIYGEQRLIEIRKTPVVLGPDEKLDAIVEKAFELRDKGGWSRLNAVTRRFGSLGGDGYYWEEEDPESPLGFLWSRALVMVGKAVIEGRRTKIATIPIELRQPLKEILGLT